MENIITIFLQNESSIAFLTCLVSILSLLVSIISLVVSTITNRKNRKQDFIYRDKAQEFEIQKEKIRQQERKTDEVFMRLNSRSNLIPYFHLVLDNSKIEKVGNWFG